MCGPSGAEKSIANQQQNFFSQLQSSYAQNFGAQSAILGQLQQALSPILQSGPNQMGFSQQENAALNSQAINNAATANRNAQVIAGSNVGGNTGVTTGGQKQLQAQIATGVGNNLSSNLNNIALQNAQTGRQNFFGAESALGGVANSYNPAQFASLTNTAGGNAFGAANSINQQKNQEFADIGGALTGLGGGLLGGLSGGLNNLDRTGGSSFGEQFGNFFTGAMGGSS